ncbi:MAG: SEC-C metal-binding domain-containing protein [Acidithiobacillales bacterium]
MPPTTSSPTSPRRRPGSKSFSALVGDSLPSWRQAGTIPAPCRSGKKFKKCCLRTGEESPSRICCGAGSTAPTRR